MWSKLETDHLIGLALKYDLRWPVIKDRYKCTPDRPVQDLQQRFYDVANRLQVYLPLHTTAVEIYSFEGAHATCPPLFVLESDRFVGECARTHACMPLVSVV